MSKTPVRVLGVHGLVICDSELRITDPALLDQSRVLFM